MDLAQKIKICPTSRAWSAVLHKYYTNVLCTIIISPSKLWMLIKFSSYLASYCKPTRITNFCGFYRTNLIGKRGHWDKQKCQINNDKYHTSFLQVARQNCICKHWGSPTHTHTRTHPRSYAPALHTNSWCVL